jgi:NADH-quinone oxidoreductase subunit C
MTRYFNGREAANLITPHFPEAVAETGDTAVVIKSESLPAVMEYLKNNPELTCDYLIDITAVDYLDYFEVVYRPTSLERNHGLVIKVRCYDRAQPVVPSVTGVWHGADFMEREIFDLFGIVFAGHPNLKRIFLWEGFRGYPLRRDYLGAKG